MTHRVYNFSAGPAVLPDDVLKQAQEELLDWQNTGSSVMEISHRGEAFLELLDTVKNNLRTLINIPKNYRILFLQGGARLQFHMVPLNLALPHQVAEYLTTGHWSKLAMDAAKPHLAIHQIASDADKNHGLIREEKTWVRYKKAAYCHFASNETVNGIQFPVMPTPIEGVPLVCDMSSDFMSRAIAVDQFGLIYAGAQKNIGIAGLTLVIIREDLLQRSKRTHIPHMLEYQLYADTNSLINTPPTFAIYMAGLIFEWLKKQGGVKAIQERNAQKAALLYNTIDQSDGFYDAPIKGIFRSQMNVVFYLKNEALNTLFLKNAQENHLMYLKGHTALGGMRASIYNAMTLEGVRALAGFMKDFAKQYG